MTRSKHEPRFAPNAIHEPTRGVRLLPDRPERPNPYGVQWSERTWDAATGRDTRQVKSRFFSNAKDRDAHAANLRRERQEGALRTLSRPEADEWRAFRAVIGATPC